MKEVTLGKIDLFRAHAEFNQLYGFMIAQKGQQFEQSFPAFMQILTEINQEMQKFKIGE